MSPIDKKKKRADKSERFSFVTDEEIARGCEGVIPANTKLSNQSAAKILAEWMDSRANTDEPVPEHLLSNENPDGVCGWLCRFVQETRKVDGSRYPPSTIRSLLSAFQRVVEKNKLSYRLFDTSDLRFSDLRKTFDTVCVDLRKMVLVLAVIMPQFSLQKMSNLCGIVVQLGPTVHGSYCMLFSWRLAFI